MRGGAIRHITVSLEEDCVKMISRENGEEIESVKFQSGPVREVGLNGIFVEDLLEATAKRLETYQNSKYNCDENEEALQHVREALKSLDRRTQKRILKNVEGTSKL